MLGQLDEELGISWQMMDVCRFAASEARHCLDALPGRYRDELCLRLAVVAEALNAQCLWISGLMPTS